MFEIPKENETVTIDGIIYGHPRIVPKFPPNVDLKRVQAAMRSWNADTAHKRAGLRFSVVSLKPSAKDIAELKKFSGIPKELLEERYTLCSWQRIGYTKEYEKTHPWINYDSYHDWQMAMAKKKAGKK